MNFSQTYTNFITSLSKLKDLPLLFMRLILAYGFFNPAKMKWQDINSIADWFKEMGIPAPIFSAYLSAGTEALGVVLLVLGLSTRFITIPLIILLLVAIKTVHWTNGFEAGENGYEIPVYYIIMLLTLFIYGAGKISLDYLLIQKMKRRTIKKITSQTHSSAVAIK